MLTEDGVDQTGKQAGMSFRLGQYRLRLWKTGYEFMSKAGGYVTPFTAPGFVQAYRELDRYQKRELWSDLRKIVLAVGFIVSIVCLATTAAHIAIEAAKHKQAEQAATAQAPPTAVAPRTVEEVHKHKGK